MEKQTLASRQEVALLVHRFYEKVRRHAVLGPIFNGIITDWDSHLELLTDFWESQLFLKRTYLGNPVAVHQAVDAHMQHTLTPEHFGFWMNMWFETLDEGFEGETAWIAKNRAQKMSTMLYLKMYEARQAGPAGGAPG